jgi:hypothetical protein
VEPPLGWPLEAAICGAAGGSGVDTGAAIAAVTGAATVLTVAAGGLALVCVWATSSLPFGGKGVGFGRLP